jgi:GAF domain-containing protein
MALANFFVHKESAKVIGRAYLQRVPEESEVSRLVAGICSLQVEQHTECAKAAPKRYRDLLLQQQQQDFEHGRVVSVAGWILSQTEARLCALATLL